MSGRGDKNKNGTSGQGAGNQSGQGFAGTDHQKMNHGEQTGGQPSQPTERSTDQSADRNQSQEGGEERR